MKVGSPSKILSIWTCMSVFVGPLIAATQYRFTRGGGDFCDGIYYLQDGSLDPSRIDEFARANIYADTLSTIMLTVGVVLLIRYWTMPIPSVSIIRRLLLTCTTLFMFVGYLLIITVFSGSGFQAC
jgi:hypothetical protein